MEARERAWGDRTLPLHHPAALLRYLGPGTSQVDATRGDASELRARECRDGAPQDSRCAKHPPSFSVSENIKVLYRITLSSLSRTLRCVCSAIRNKRHDTFPRHFVPYMSQNIHECYPWENRKSRVIRSGRILHRISKILSLSIVAKG